MTVLRHWLIGGHDTSERQPTVITDPILAERWARRGEEVLGPFVLEAQLQGAANPRRDPPWGPGYIGVDTRCCG